MQGLFGVMKKALPYAIAWTEMVWPGLSKGLRIVRNFIGLEHPLIRIRASDLFGK
jgi:hypothetical protein